MNERSEPSVVAELVAGVLAANGLLFADTTADDAAAVLRAMHDSAAFWTPVYKVPQPDAGRRLEYRGLPLPRWRRPNAGSGQPPPATLEAAWVAAGLTPPANASAPSALRLQMAGIDDCRAWQGRRVDEAFVATHAALRAGRFAWRWPIRIAFPGPPGLEDVVGGGQYVDRLYRVAPAAGEAEIAVVDPRRVGELDTMLATVAVVVDGAGWDPSPLLDRAARIGLAAVLLVPGRPPAMIDRLVDELAHDYPLDAAAARAVPEAVLLADEEFLAFTSIRLWSAHVGRGLVDAEGRQTEPGEMLLIAAREMTFDHEYNGAVAVSEVAARLDEDEIGRLTSVRLDRAAGLPPGDEHPSRTPPPPPPPAPAPVPAPSDERRLQAELRDSDGTVRTDAFVAGQRHQLRVRIAADVAPGAVAADALFPAPEPGKAVDLTVVARLRGSTTRPVRRTLRLPAAAGSAWTKPMPIDVPRAATEAVVEIVVLAGGRAVQTAALGGPVVTAGAPAGGGLSLKVDADTPPAGLEGRTTSPATLVVSPTASGAPQVIDLSRLGRALPADRLEKANKAVRRILFDAFMAPPPDLAGAAPVLTKLAVRGATLRNQLKGNANAFHDDDPWVQVISFGQADLPFELIYNHPMPDDDDAVPVCDAALGGATECLPQCPDRQRSDRVCPFGFWGTSKVVERRLHVDDRVGVAPPAQRRLAVTAGAVVGTSNKTDEEDAKASERIVEAVKAAVDADHFRRIATWHELSDAVQAAEPGVLVLVTHSIKPDDEDDDLGVSLELGGDILGAHRVDQRFVNPSSREPGPVVLSLGCDTDNLDVGYADWVSTLHAARAEVVVSTLSPVPGREVADFVERVFAELPAQLAGEGPHRCGALLTAVRRATIAKGDVLALALTASGDGDVELVGL